MATVVQLLDSRARELRAQLDAHARQLDQVGDLLRGTVAQAREAVQLGQLHDGALLRALLVAADEATAALVNTRAACERIGRELHG